MNRGCRFCLVLLAAWSLAGCGVKVKVQESTPALGRALDDGAIVAVVGVAASPAAGRLLPADAAAAADALYASLLEGMPGLAAWAAPVTAEALGGGVADSLLGDYGRLGGLPAAEVTRLRDRLPAVSYLVLARVKADAIEMSVVAADRIDAEARAEGLPQNTNPLAQSVTTRRHTTIELEFVDLRSGESAWRGAADVDDFVRYEYERPTVDPLAPSTLPRPGEPPIISRDGGTVRAPDLIGVVAKGCGSLIRELTKATSGQP